MTGQTLTEIGIIYPPPELRNVVDKTAGFVANSKNGPEFESRIRDNEAKNAKFNFLNPGDPYNAYYRNKVKELREAKESGVLTVPTTTSAATPAGSNQQDPRGKDNETSTTSQFFPRTSSPPPPFEYSVDPPSLQALELDIVKLTAQFVAVHGRFFLNNLMQKESRNYQFDFVRPQHGLFQYFSQLCEQYSRIVIVRPDTIVQNLRKEVAREKDILDRVRHRLQWTQIQEVERQRSMAEAEKERQQYASIDWHDFVVVEAVDYQPHEHGKFPPPTTPEQVGSRILLQQRMEQQGADEIEMDLDDEEDNNDEDVDDDDEQRSKRRAEEESAKAMPPPLPPSLDNVVIRKDYNPKVSTGAGNNTSTTTTAGNKESWVISPITGQKIPAEKLEEHMRYGLLDPRWREQQNKMIQERSQQDQVLAPGTAIESSLRQLAERRTDIFGSGAEETAIGSKIGEEEKKGPEKVIWDGYTSSAQAAVISAQSKITIEEQIEDIKRRMYPDSEKEKIGPKVDNYPSHHSRPPHPQNLLPSQPRPPPPHLPLPMRPNIGSGLPLLPNPSNPFILPNPGMLPPHRGHHPPHLGMHAFPPDPSMIHAMVSSLAGLPPQLPQPGVPVSAPGTGGGDDEDSGPSAKKQKTEDNLIPEDEFLKSSPSVVNIRVSVPDVSANQEWKLSGQTLNFSLDVKETLSGVKTRIHEATGMPPGKQKLQFEGIFVKDSNSLAFYNMSNGATIHLLLKERGGRKK